MEFCHVCGCWKSIHSAAFLDENASAPDDFMNDEAGASQKRWLCELPEPRKYEPSQKTLSMRL
jgi:hypothetical protein